MAAPNYSVEHNPMPGAQVTSTYSHNAGGWGITPSYGYYVSEFPSLNDYGYIAGRTDVANSPNPMVTGPGSGQAAVWIDGVVKNVAGVNCRDRDGDGNADATSCGSRALAINNLGKVGGSAHISMAGRDSYFEYNQSWWPNEEGDYDSLGGNLDLSFAASQSQIQDINEQSLSVGNGITPGGAGPQDGLAHGLVGSQYIGIQYQASRAHAVNENNQVTGTVIWNDTDDYGAGLPTSSKVYTWLSGELSVVQDGIVDPAYFSEGYDINDSGLVVGHMGWTRAIRAFKWASPSGGLEDLGTLGGSQSVARSVNNAGTIIGWASTLSGAKHAFVYEDGIMYDLNEYAIGAPGFVIVDAYSINEMGQILVRAHNNSSNEHQYWLLTDPDSPPAQPPEPLPDAVEVRSMSSFATNQDQPIETMAAGDGSTISIGYFNVDGYFRGGNTSIDFDPSSAEDIHSITGEGVYIQKLDANGDYLWTKTLPGWRMTGAYTRNIADLFVEPDGSFHIVGWIGRLDYTFLEINPDPDVREFVRDQSFRATYSSTGELKSWVFLNGDMRPQGVTVDDDRNIYVAYNKDGRSSYFNGVDFDPGVNEVFLPSRPGQSAIVVTKTSRDAVNVEQLEWVRSLSSVGRSYNGYNAINDDDYAWIHDIDIAAPAVAGEGPMVAFSYRGAIDFQVYDSNLGLLGDSLVVDTGGTTTRNGFIRMAGSGEEPGVLWMAPEEYDARSVKLVRSGEYFGMLSGNRFLVHGIAAEAGYNHISKILTGRLDSMAISPRGDLYVSGEVRNRANFDTTGYDVQGKGSSSGFITRINANGSYGWTFTYRGISYPVSAPLTVDRFDNVTAIGKLSNRDWLTEDGYTPTGDGSILITRLRSLSSQWSHTGGNYFPNETPAWMIDTDGDGFTNDRDFFPNDTSEWLDTDGDGIGDNQDAFPNDGSEWLDTDGDGTGDNQDVFPDDASEWLDSDGDGVGDNQDAFPNDASRWLDSDGDGFADDQDAFPYDGSEWLDSDGDGVGDNSDIFPNDPALSRIEQEIGYVHTIGSSSDRGDADVVNSVYADSYGNVYQAGSYLGTMDFDSSSAVDERSSGNYDRYGYRTSQDAYVIKTNADGTYAWSWVSRGYYGAAAHDVTTDEDGNVYISGRFSGDTYFDPNDASGTGNATGWAPFVVKLDSQGNYLWSYTIYERFKRADLLAHHIALDSQNNVYIAGAFNSPRPIDFDSGPNQDHQVSLGYVDLFVSRINADGSYGWTYTAGGDRGFIGTTNLSRYIYGGIVIDAQDRIYVGGKYSGTVDFDGDGIADDVSSSGNGFVIQLNTVGEFAWKYTDLGSVTDMAAAPQGLYVLAAGDLIGLDNGGNRNSTRSVRGSLIDVDGVGNVFVSGNYSGTVDFNKDEEDVDYRTSAGSTDFYVTQYSASGEYNWTRSFGGPGRDIVREMSVTPDGEILLTGTFFDTIDFGEGLVKTSSGYGDIFLLLLTKQPAIYKNTGGI
ncbi:MAG: hypothetical protein L3J89_04080 [Gammaproteobacteria bacterium]|nr:hypothetical protein [Gammaproteobacteria bacterium]